MVLSFLSLQPCFKLSRMIFGVADVADCIRFVTWKDVSRGRIYEVSNCKAYIKVAT